MIGPGTPIAANRSHPINIGKVAWFFQCNKGGTNVLSNLIGQAVGIAASGAYLTNGPARPGDLGLKIYSPSTNGSGFSCTVDSILNNLPNGNFSWAHWIYNYANPSTSTYLSKGYYGAALGWASWRSSGSLAGFIYGTSSSYRYYTGPSTSNNVWYRVLWTWNANAKSLALYLNGKPQTLTNSSSGSYTAYSGDAASNLIIGNEGGTKTQPAEAYIDDIPIWNITLTPDQAMLDFVESSTGYRGGLLRDPTPGIFYSLPTTPQYDPSLSTFFCSDTPRPLPTRNPLREIAFADPTSAFWLNDPNKLDPASTFSWPPSDIPRKVTRPVALQQQNHTDPTLTSQFPSLALFVLPSDPHPRPVLRQPIREVAFADPTPGFFLPNQTPIPDESFDSQPIQGPVRFAGNPQQRLVIPACYSDPFTYVFTAAFFLKDPGDPVPDLCWDVTQPVPGPVRWPARTTPPLADYYDEPQSPTVLPTPIDVPDYGDQPKGIPRFRYPRPLIEQAYAEPTGAFFLPGVPPGTYQLAWLGQDPIVVRIPRYKRSGEDVTCVAPQVILPPPAPPPPDPGMPPLLAESILIRSRVHLIPFGDQVFNQLLDETAYLQTWNVPPEQPMPARRLPIGSEPAGILEFSYQAITIPWEVDVVTPVPARQRSVAPEGRGPELPVTDGLTDVAGWRQEMPQAPVRLPKPLRIDVTPLTPNPVIDDPQSLSVPLMEQGQPAVWRPSIQRGDSPDPTAAIEKAVEIADDVYEATWGQPYQDRPLPRPRPQVGDFAFCLDTSESQAAPVPWQDVDVRPLPVRKLPWEGGTTEPPWYSSVSIIVAGPYYAVAQTIWVSGAVTGMVGTE